MGMVTAVSKALYEKTNGALGLEVFRVQGLGFRVQVLGFRVSGLGFRV